MNEAVTLPLVAGVVATLITEAANRLTPNTKFRPQTIQAFALTVAAVGVVGWKVAHEGAAAVDWNVAIPQVVAAWGVALGAHDVASPRT